MSKKQACQAPKKAIDVEVTFFPGLTLTGKFGTYVIEGFISSGSFSKVFTGYHQDTKEKYALKFMNYLMDGMTESSLLLAVNELDPRYRNYLCKICDVVNMENARNIGLVVERGACSLLDVMNANDLHPLHIRHVKTIMHQLFCALEGLHSIHILHADVKPENILLRRTTKIFRGRLPDNRLAIELMDLHIMLCDFNCSKYVPHWVRKPDDTIQTFHYRAPEIVLNTETTEIIDIFSAGAMLAELASGYIVFDMESKNILAPGLEERAKHLRLMEREIGQCPKEVYQKSPDKYFSSGEWIKCSALAPSHSWFKDWREEISIAGTDEENDLLEVIDHTMTWPDRRANAQEAVTLRFFGHFHCDTPRDTFYENMKPISADDLLSMKCDEHENGAELLRKEPELINCNKTIKIEEDVQSPPMIRESPKRYKTRSSILGMPAKIVELDDRPKHSTIVSICYSDGLLGAAVYIQKTSTVRILHDTGESDEFKIIDLLFDQVEPNIVLLCKSQDLSCVRYLSEKCKSEQDTTDSGDENNSAESSAEVYQLSETSQDDVVADSQDPTNLQEVSDDAEEEFDPFKDATLHLMPSNAYRFDQAVARIGELFSSEALSKCEADLILQFRLETKAVNMVRAFGALLRYMDAARIGVEYDTMNIRTPVSAIKTFVLDKMVEIDYSTYRALEIFCEDKKKEIGWRKALKQKGAGGASLFSLMNRCRSPLGKHTLMNWFSHPTLNRETLRSRQKAISFFVQDCNADITAFIHQSLGKIRNIKMVLKRMCGALIKPNHWKNLQESLKALLEIGKCLKQKEIHLDIMDAYESFGKESITEATFLLSHIVDIEGSIAEGRLVANALIDSDLDELKTVYKGLPQLLTRIAQEEASRLGAEHCSVGYVPIVGYILSLPIDFPATMFSDLKMVYTADDRAHFKSRRMDTLDEQVGDIKMQIVDKETTIALRLQRSILDKSDIILEAYRAAATLDAIISMAMTARQFGWNCPTLSHHPVIEASRSSHPLTQMLSPDRIFIPNDICLGGNDTKVKIFTGPNACGKSVYMKQVAILSFLAHIGSFVPAQKAIIGPVNRILTRVYTVDGVLDGMSTFAKDLQQLALALRRANQVFDEFGKGTLTEVGLSLLSSSINYWLAKGRNSCPHLLVSSHFHALPKFLLNDNNELSFHTFEVIKRGNRLDYQFRLVDGLIDCSHAAYTAAQMGIPDDVVKRSNEIYTALREGAHTAEVMIPNVMQSKYEFLAEHMGHFLEDFLTWNIRGDCEGFLNRAEEILLDESEEVIEDGSFIANCSMHVSHIHCNPLLAQTPHEVHSDDGSPTMQMIESNADGEALTEEANVGTEITPQEEAFKKPAELSGHTSSDPTLCSITIVEEQIFEIPSSVTSSILKHRFKSVTRENLSVSFAASPVRVRCTHDTSMETPDEFMRPPSPIKRFNELFPSEDGDELSMPEKRKRIK